MTGPEAQERFQRWLEESGSEAAVDPAGAQWTVVTDDVWVMTPPGRANALYVITPDLVRPVRPSDESLEQVLADLGVPTNLP